MLTKLFPIIGIFILVNCSDSKKKNGVEDKEVVNASHDLNWLEGNWIDSTVFNGRSFFVENWKKNDEDVFVGEKFQIVKMDSSSPTQLNIIKTDNKFYYSYFQKEEQTTFVQDSIAQNFISFRNTTDKFPANLNYKRNSDTLVISFSGMANGVYRSSHFKTILIK